MTEPDNTDVSNDIDNAITGIFIVIDNYGTAEEARQAIQNLIAQEANKARLDSLKHVRMLIKALHSFSGTDFTKEYDKAIEEMLGETDRLIAQLTAHKESKE